jgi:hypothetical protein
MLRRRDFLARSAVAAAASLSPLPLAAQPVVRQAVRGTGPLTITAIEPIVIRAPREGSPPEGPLASGAVGATTGGRGLWDRLDHASPSRTPGVEQATLVRVTTNQGLIGWGECHAPVAPRMQARIITDLFRPLLVGQDARQVASQMRKCTMLSQRRSLRCAVCLLVGSLVAAGVFSRSEGRVAAVQNAPVSAAADTAAGRVKAAELARFRALMEADYDTLASMLGDDLV